MSKNPRVYSPQGLTEVSNPVIVSDAAPTVADINFSIGQLWVNESTDTIYALVDFDSSGAVWTASASFSGAATVESLVIDPGDLDMTAGGELLLGTSGGPFSDTTQYGDFDLTGNLSVIGDTVLTGALDITGDVTISGDFDLTDSAAILIKSTSNTNPAVTLQADGGILETVNIISSQGTSASSVLVNSVAGGVTISGGLATADAINISSASGGIDVDAALLISLTSTRNHEAAIELVSTAGGINITASGGAATEDIDILASTSSVNITAGESVADAIVINASGAAGATVIKAGTGGVLIGNEADTTTLDLGNIAPTASRTVTIGGGTVVTAAVTDTISIAGGGATTNADSIKTLNLNTGGVTTGQVLTNIASGAVTSGTHTTAIASGNRAAGTMALNVMTGTGTKTANIGNADALTTLNIDAITLINDSVNANVSLATGTSTGAVAIGNSLAGAMSIDSAAGISLDGATASNFTVSAAGEDLTLSSTLGSIAMTAGEAVATAIVMNASAGAGGISLQAGTGGIEIGNQVDCTIIDVGDFAPTATRLITVGGGTIVTAAVTDTIDIGPDGATTNADSIKTVNINTGGVTTGQVLTNIASGAVTSGTHTTAIASGNRAAGTMALNVMTGTGTKTANIGNADGLTTVNIDAITLINDSINVNTSINTGTSTGAVAIGNSLAGAMSIDTAAGISLDGATASNFTTSAAAADLSLISTLGSINITAGESAADSIVITSSIGGIDILASGASAGEDIDIIATGSSVNITSTEAVASAIVLTASNAAGGIQLTTGGGAIALSSAGNVTMTPSTASAASATTNVTINARVGIATFTGFTTAAAASQTFTVSNSAATGVSQGLFVTASHTGSNDAVLSVSAKNVSGTLTFIITNNGSAAVNGSINLAFWLIN